MNDPTALPADAIMVRELRSGAGVILNDDGASDALVLTFAGTLADGQPAEAVVAIPPAAVPLVVTRLTDLAAVMTGPNR